MYPTIILLIRWYKNGPYIDDLVQDGSKSSALAIELLQSCTDPSIYGKLPNIHEIFHNIE